MAINFTRLFESLGLYVGALNETNTFRDDLDTREATLLTQWGGDAPYNAFVSPLPTNVESAQRGLDTWVTVLNGLAQNSIVNEVVADRPLVSATLDNAITELARQMRSASESLNAVAYTLTVGDVGTPGGDHKIVTVAREGKTGLAAPFVVPEVVRVQCTTSRSSGGTQYGETFTVVGTPAATKVTDAAYPTGTGLSTSVTAINPATSGGVVTDGGFNNWTGSGDNTPVSWPVFGSTVAGTHVQRVNDDPRGGTGYSLKLIGDGSVVPRVRQQVTLQANSTYAFHARLKKVLDPGTDWAVTFRLVDSGGSAVTGNGSYSNVITSAAASSVAADWTNVVTGTFCTPATLPVGGVFLDITFHENGNVATAPASTAAVNVDHVACHLTTPLYTGGFGLKIFSGITEGTVGDLRTVTAALSSGAVEDYLLLGINRLLNGGLASATERLPVSGSPTQADALVL